MTDPFPEITTYEPIDVPTTSGFYWAYLDNGDQAKGFLLYGVEDRSGQLFAAPWAQGLGPCVYNKVGMIGDCGATWYGPSVAMPEAVHLMEHKK